MSGNSSRSLASRLVPSAMRDRIVRSAEARNARQLRQSREERLPAAPQAFQDAYAAYWETGRVPDDAGELLFLATWASGGELPRRLSTEYAPAYEPSTYAAFSDDLLGALDAEAAAEEIRRHGYYVAPDLLDADIVDDIRTTLEAGPAVPRGDRVGEMAPGAPAPTAPTWWMEPGDTVGSPAARGLLRQRALVDVAGRYLGADPMIMSIALWKSFAWENSDKRSAQEFHYDNDRSSFLKMFVYLSDVGDENGPHTYVPGSHGEKPKELLHGERIGDDDVARFYPRDGWATITGPKGTVFFADTQGFHKGGRLTAGDRSMFQINLASDRFGSADAPVGIAADAPSDLVGAVSSAPRYFEQLYASEHPVP